ncbi:hypothetical protein GMPD_32900 [Geomonas paludis]|uniref:Uncharacterized protein n=1 Tax=Geomonas paludis TaxID=2740185 RepID=A0A6V8MZ15_9BACT|nr:hypothetical protein GMPD_32900 [Geomonas paludis]
MAADREMNNVGSFGYRRGAWSRCGTWHSRSGRPTVCTGIATLSALGAKTLMKLAKMGGNYEPSLSPRERVPEGRVRAVPAAVISPLAKALTLALSRRERGHGHMWQKIMPHRDVFGTLYAL